MAGHHVWNARVLLLVLGAVLLAAAAAVAATLLAEGWEPMPAGGV